MSKLTKNQKLVADKIEAGKAYTLKEASALVKEITTTKFDASVDIDVRLGVDPRKANQMVRGVVSLPNGTGKVTRVLCLCTPDAEAAAKEAGADYVGLDEYIEKIKGGWTDIDVIITMPSIMGKIHATETKKNGRKPSTPKIQCPQIPLVQMGRQGVRKTLVLQGNIGDSFLSLPPKILAQ